MAGAEWLPPIPDARFSLSGADGLLTAQNGVGVGKLMHELAEDHQGSRFSEDLDVLAHLLFVKPEERGDPQIDNYQMAITLPPHLVYTSFLETGMDEDIRTKTILHLEDCMVDPYFFGYVTSDTDKLSKFKHIGQVGRVNHLEASALIRAAALEAINLSHSEKIGELAIAAMGYTLAKLDTAWEAAREEITDQHMRALPPINWDDLLRQGDDRQ